MSLIDLLYIYKYAYVWYVYQYNPDPKCYIKSNFLQSTLNASLAFSIKALEVYALNGM